MPSRKEAAFRRKQFSSLDSALRLRLEPQSYHSSAAVEFLSLLNSKPKLVNIVLKFDNVLLDVN